MPAEVAPEILSIAHVHGKGIDLHESVLLRDILLCLVQGSLSVSWPSGCCTSIMPWVHYGLHYSGCTVTCSNIGLEVEDLS